MTSIASRSTLWLLTLAALVFSSRASAQEFRFPPPPPEFRSPEVAENRDITFRIHAPSATRVALSGGDIPGLGFGREMKKEDKGIWTLTVSSVQSGAYRYTFNVDGVAVVDPRNPATSESNASTASLVYVPGSDSSDTKDVPHGAVAELTYRSKSLDRFRRAHIYTPPGYENGEGKFPVLYLLHGAMDCDDSWTTVGRAGFILDNLIAAGKAKPMIVVMPHGHTGSFSFGPGGGNTFEQQMTEFQKDFEDDLKPLVEKTYRIQADRDHRAIAGLSMGGAQTLNIAMTNLKDYGYFGVFSSGVFGIAGGPFPQRDPKWQDVHTETLKKADLKTGLKLVWFATGKEDFLLETTRGTVKELEKNQFTVTYHETDGGHTWAKWRDYLTDFAPLLFQDK
jgi:enterochelin esterase-like enzyme